MPTTASTVNAHMRTRRFCRTPESIYTVVIEGDHVIGMTEPMLDAWWHSLTPEEKAHMHDLSLEDAGDESEAVFHGGPQRVFERAVPVLTLEGIAQALRTDSWLGIGADQPASEGVRPESEATA